MKMIAYAYGKFCRTSCKCRKSAIMPNKSVKLFLAVPIISFAKYLSVGDSTWLLFITQQKKQYIELHHVDHIDHAHANEISHAGSKAVYEIMPITNNCGQNSTLVFSD
jgi:hypothetical protein